MSEHHMILGLLDRSIARVRELEEERSALLAREVTQANRADALQSRLAAMTTERDQWRDACGPSICSAHQKLDMTCHMCNPAIIQRDSALARVKELEAAGYEARKEYAKLGLQLGETVLERDVLRARLAAMTALMRDIVNIYDMAQRCSYEQKSTALKSLDVAIYKGAEALKAAGDVV